MLTSLTGEFIVDLMGWDRAKRTKEHIIYREDYKDFDITKMENYIARPLKTSGFGASN